VTEPFLPTSEGAEQVVRAARARRLGKLGGLGTTALVAVLGLVMLGSSGPGGKARVDEITTVPSSASPNPAPTKVGSGTGDATPAQAARPAASTLVAPGGRPSPGVVSPQPTEPRNDTRPSSPITRAQAGYLSSTDLCQDGNPPGSLWCMRVFAPDVIHRGHPARLGITACLMPTAQPTTVTFPTTREVEVDLLRSYDSAVVWQAGEGIQYRSPGGSLTFQPGQCYRWTSSWDTRDREGFLVPPGDYPISVGLEGVADGTGTSVTVED
jgi:hypothetical protein